jgi:glycosyltransferase involved in cell wall biosynthesis
MRVFFIAPWPALDPLSASTVVPHLAELARDGRVAGLTFFSCEQGRLDSSSPFTIPGLPAGVHHQPLAGPAGLPLPLVRRIRHHASQANTLLQAARQQRPNLVICRGTSGIYGHLLQRRLGVPYVVESFEPHAHYMLQSGTWQRWDPKYIVQRRWEARVKRTASALITVSHRYAKHLQTSEGLEASRLHTVPCWIDAERYSLNPDARSRLRAALGIGNRLAVIYAGKFGGIYAPVAQLAMLHTLQRALGRELFVILLTPHDPKAVHQQLGQSGFASHQCFVGRVAYAQVSDYLNAADLALSFWSSGPWSFACSPIKHGESWACGLPLLMPPGIGDEAQWLESERAGAIATFTDPSSVAAAAQRLKPILAEPSHRQRIRSIALRERGPEPLLQVYGQLLDQFSAVSPADG